LFLQAKQHRLKDLSDFSTVSLDVTLGVGDDRLAKTLCVQTSWLINVDWGLADELSTVRDSNHVESLVVYVDKCFTACLVITCVSLAVGIGG